MRAHKGPVRFTPNPSCSFVPCMHVFVGPPACVHPCLVCVSCMLSLCLCTAALPSAPMHCILGLPVYACKALWVQAQPGTLCRVLCCLPGRPGPLTQGPSLQLEQAVRLESGELETPEPRGLVRQSVELRRQLQEEQASYRRKLQAYQEGQQRQAQLVQRLQAKVRATHSSPSPLYSLCPTPPPRANLPLPTHPQTLQYKKKCSELEQQLVERSTELERQRLRVGARVGQGRPFPLPVQADAPLLPSRTQSTAMTWRAPLSAWRRSSRGGGAAGRVQGWQGCPLLPCAHRSLSHPQECQLGPGELHAPRAAGPGELG